MLNVSRNMGGMNPMMMGGMNPQMRAGRRHGARGRSGLLPLFYAWHLDVVRYLCEQGANKEHADSEGATPVLNACSWGYLDVMLPDAARPRS